MGGGGRNRRRNLRYAHTPRSDPEVRGLKERKKKVSNRTQLGGGESIGQNLIRGGESPFGTMDSGIVRERKKHLQYNSGE